MARAEGLTSKWKIAYEVCFESVARGHHVYKDKWTPYNGEKLICGHDSREEASYFDKNAIGIYKKVDADKNVLVGHIPMELSFLLRCFLDSDKENGIIAEVTGHRVRENGLVVPCRYKARSKKLKIADTLIKELKLASGLYTHMSINVLDFKAEKKVCYY